MNDELVSIKDSSQDDIPSIIKLILVNAEKQIQENEKNEMDYLRFKSQFRLKLSFEKIFEKYGREFQSDEIDLETGEIVVDHGVLSNLNWQPLGNNVEDIKDEELEYCRELYDSVVGELDRAESCSDQNSSLVPRSSGYSNGYYDDDYFDNTENEYDGNQPYHRNYDLKRPYTIDDYNPYVHMIKRIRYVEQPVIRITKRYISTMPLYTIPLNTLYYPSIGPQRMICYPDSPIADDEYGFDYYQADFPEQECYLEEVDDLEDLASEDEVEYEEYLSENELDDLLELGEGTMMPFNSEEGLDQDDEPNEDDLDDLTRI